MKRENKLSEIIVGLLSVPTLLAAAIAVERIPEIKRAMPILGLILFLAVFVYGGISLNCTLTANGWGRIGRYLSLLFMFFALIGFPLIVVSWTSWGLNLPWF